MKSKLLIIKTGSYSARAQRICDEFGDQEAVFMSAGKYPIDGVDVVEVFNGEKLARPPQEYKGILVTGSGFMLSKPEPWMDNTAAWLREAISARIPTLGICFGHQMIAYALGSRIDANPNGLEVGKIKVEFNQESRSDPLFSVLPETGFFNSHHYETVVDLPEGASVLASNAMDKHQAIRFADQAWGAQFHPEIGGSLMLTLLEVLAEGLEKRGESVTQLKEAITDTPYGPVLLKRFYELAMAGPPQCA
ncbi:glutamine amidotransferase [Mesorhizobium sp. 2RAF21]|uniref:glutamine amidotransferase n=1 Tax=Mesorhizobium sp. 2RAF21 TaxID=3232995 RepID=UPI003F9E1DEA